MKKILAAVICAVMLVSALSIGTCVSADDVKRPSGFMPWYSFEDLSIGAGPSHTGDLEDDPLSVSMNGVEAITCDLAMEQKIGLLTCEVTEGGAAGKLLKYGGGPKLKVDNPKYGKSGVWWPVTVSAVGDPTYCNKEFSDAAYFCFYIDMTNWTTDYRREKKYAACEQVGFFPFIQIGHIGDDGMNYSATCALQDGKDYELQQPNGSWKVIPTKLIEEKDKSYTDVTIESTGEVIHCTGENGTIQIPTDFKGYVRFKLQDTYEVTYYDATAPEWGIRHQKTFKVNSIVMNTGLYTQAVGVGGEDDRAEPGSYVFGDFGFLPADPEAPKPVADESKAEESKEEDSKAEESKEEESKEEPSKVEASKAEESVVPAETETNNSHKGLWIALGVILVVLIGGGVAAFFIVKKQKANAVGSEAVMEEPDVSQPEDDSTDSTDSTDNTDNTDDKNE